MIPLKPLFSCLVGSRLYGLYSEGSDYDWRGVTVPPLEYLLGLEKFEQYESSTEDSVVYSLAKWLHMLANASMQTLEAMYSTQVEFSDNGHYLFTRISQAIPDIVSNKYYSAIKAYASNEFRRASGTMLIPVAGKESLLEKINGICSQAQVKSHVRDQVVELLEKEGGQKIVDLKPSPDNGPNRKDLIEKYGYDVKSACNALRLLHEGTQLFSTGRLKFPVPIELRDYKEGKHSIGRFEEDFDTAMQNFDLAHSCSVFPAKPNHTKIKELYIDLIKDYI